MLSFRSDLSTKNKNPEKLSVEKGEKENQGVSSKFYFVLFLFPNSQSEFFVEFLTCVGWNCLEELIIVFIIDCCPLISFITPTLEFKIPKFFCHICLAKMSLKSHFGYGI